MKPMKIESQYQGSSMYPEGTGSQVSLRQRSFISSWPALKQNIWLRKWITTRNKMAEKKSLLHGITV